MLPRYSSRRLRMRDGQYISVRDMGKGPALVLIHGFGMHSGHWMPFALPLSFKYRVIIPDLRGFGKSHHTPFKSDCILNDYSEDLEDICAQLNLESYKLVGISMGALASLQHLQNSPTGQIDRYLHIDQSPCCMNGEDWQWGLFGEENTQRINRARGLLDKLSPYANNRTPYEELPGNLRKALWTELGDFFASALSRNSHKNLARTLCANPALSKKILPTSNWPAYLHCLNAYIEKKYDLRAVVKDTATPITAVVGLKSEMYPPGGQLRMADYSERCEIIPLANSGHTPLIDQPLKFMQILSRFSAA